MNKYNTFQVIKGLFNYYKHFKGQLQTSGLVFTFILINESIFILSVLVGASAGAGSSVDAGVGAGVGGGVGAGVGSGACVHFIS